MPEDGINLPLFHCWKILSHYFFEMTSAQFPLFFPSLGHKHRYGGLSESSHVSFRFLMFFPTIFFLSTIWVCSSSSPNVLTLVLCVQSAIKPVHYHHNFRHYAFFNFRCSLIIDELKFSYKILHLLVYIIIIFFI